MATIPFDDLVSEMRREFPGVRLTVVPSFAEMKAALARGDNSIFDQFAETLTLGTAVKDWGTEQQRQRLREQIIAGRICTELMRAEVEE